MMLDTANEKKNDTYTALTAAGSLWQRDLNIAASELSDAAKILSGKMILVTGATGLIGSAVTELLFRVTEDAEQPVSILAAGRNREKFEKRFGPLAESPRLLFFPYEATKTCELGFHADYVIHGAGPATPEEMRRSPVETMLANLTGIKTILSYAVREKRDGRKVRVLYISSSEVYGDTQGDEANTEEKTGTVDILNPRSAYPESKRAAETLCRVYKEEYDVDAVIVRPGHIYGPGASTSDNRIQADFARRAAAGEPLKMNSPGTQLRSYCYVADCASAILRVLLSGEAGEAYNISNRASVITVRDMAEKIAAAGGVTLTVPDPDADFAAATGAYSSMQNASLDSRKLEALGWQGHFSAEEGFAHTIRILRGE